MLTGNQAAAQPPAGGQAPAAPQNLKVLQPQDVRAAMGAFTQALGVQCNYCHVAEGQGGRNDFAADDKQTKKTARVMMRMVTHVNEMVAGGVDIVIIASIGDATIHLLWENVTDRERLTTYLYPMDGRTFQLGVNWDFLN